MSSQGPDANWCPGLFDCASCYHLRRQCCLPPDTRYLMTAWRALQSLSSAEQRPKAAATQRAAPTARRLGCHLRNDLIFQGLGQHKALQSKPWIVAPRPCAARLCTQCLFDSEVPHSRLLCKHRKQAREPFDRWRALSSAAPAAAPIRITPAGVEADIRQGDDLA